MIKKGISPLVAVVILIALVITVGGLISSWISTFVIETSNQDTCAISTIYSVTEVSHNETTGHLKARITNSGQDTVHNFTVEADNGSMIVTIAPTSPASTYELDPGQSQYLLANTTNYNITSIDVIRVIAGSCPGYVPTAVKVTNI